MRVLKAHGSDAVMTMNYTKYGKSFQQTSVLKETFIKNDSDFPKDLTYPK
jgi:hypothetical protein